MSPQRWREIEDLYHAALNEEPAARGALLERVDPELRREVESLLANSSGLLDAVVSAGTQMGPYRIGEPIGKGGMGEVYRARDTRLHREVAVKVLPQGFATEAARERFQREARAASALNHPHICSVYDVGESGGHPFLVMELLDGRTLRELIDSKALDIPQAVALSIQVADALEAAHGKGIVHRDIKPANIFVNGRGDAKVLDFGLASQSGLANSEAVTQALLTEPGSTMGTVAYMSPEQARGQSVDARSDLWSFGVVLYEMVTGSRPFEGPTAPVIFDGVLNKTPAPVRARNPLVPAALDRTIGRLLEKDRELRLGSAAELRAELIGIQNGAAVAAPASRNRYALWAAAAMVLIGGGVGWYLRLPKSPVTNPSEYVQLTNFSDYATAPALSKDGRMVAFFRGSGIFAGAGPVYVKQLPDGEAKQLTDDPRVKYNPVFTPDGSRVAYSVHDLKARTWSTWTVPVLGGPISLFMSNAVGLSWYGAGRLIFSEVQAGTPVHMGIETARENRAEERAIYFPAHERGMAHYSYPSPDERSIMIVEMDRGGLFQRCRVVPMDGSSPGVQVGPAGACIAGAWSPDKRWMYFNVEVEGSRHLWRQRVPDGIPEQITFGPTEQEGLALGPDGKYLITSIGVRQSSVFTHDESGDHPIPVEGSVSDPKLSADGKRLYYLVRKSSATQEVELWTRELSSGKSDRLVAGERIEDYDISADEAKVAFTARRGGSPQIFVVPLDHSLPPRLVAKDGGLVSFGPGGTLIFRYLGEKANYLSRVREDGNGFERLVDTPILDNHGASPDGDWVAVSGMAGGRRQPAGVIGGTVAVSMRDITSRLICKGLCVVRWAADGKYLYVTTVSRLMEQGRTLAIAIPRGFALTPLPPRGLDVASDEELARFQVIRRGPMAPGPDPGSYAFTTAAFQGNLFRVPLH